MPGIYLHDGANTTILVDPDTLRPDAAENFQRFDISLAYSGGALAFVHETNSGTPIGIYLYDGVDFTLVADTSTPVPGGTGTFSDFQIFGRVAVALNGDQLVFFARDPTQGPGLYLYDKGTLTTLVNNSFNRPEGVGPFADFFGFDIDNGIIAYSAAEVSTRKGFTEPSGVYVIEPGIGTLSIVQTGDLLDGDAVQSTKMGRDSLSGNQLTFQTRFQGFTREGVYRATFPIEGIFRNGFEGDPQ